MSRTLEEVADPILEELLLDHIEPKMKEIIDRYDADSDGTRTLIRGRIFDHDDNDALNLFKTGRLKFYINVAYKKDQKSGFGFNIYDDGRVEG